MIVKKSKDSWISEDSKYNSLDVDYNDLEIGGSLLLKTEEDLIVKVDKVASDEVRITPYYSEPIDDLRFIYINNHLYPLSNKVKKYKNEETNFIDFDVLKEDRMDYYIEIIDDFSLIGVIPKLNTQNFKTINEFKEDIKDIGSQVDKVDTVEIPKYMTVVKVYDDISLEQLKDNLIESQKYQKGLMIYHTGTHEFTLLSHYQLHNVITDDLIVEFKTKAIEHFDSTEVDNIRSQMHQNIKNDRNKEEDNILKGYFYALHNKTDETTEHSLRLGQICDIISAELNLDDFEVKLVRKMAAIHDVGKLAIEGKIINKPGKLNEEEFDLMKKHTILGYEMMKGIKSYEEAKVVCLQHHERWDGNGYPNKLSGNEIHPLVRIVTVADSIDAMASVRVYKEAMDWDYIKSELVKCQGRQFCPQVSKVAVDNLDIIKSLYE